jgi:plasmid stabilization system protein ParE
MEKKQVVWTKTALKKLERLFKFIAFEKKQPQNAENLVKDLQKFAETLSENYNLYPKEEEISNKRISYRSAAFKKNYRLIYRVSNPFVFISNLFHNSRNPKNKLK